MLFPIFFVIKGCDDANFMYDSITSYIFYSYHLEDVKHRASTISLFFKPLNGKTWLRGTVGVQPRLRIKHEAVLAH